MNSACFLLGISGCKYLILYPLVWVYLPDKQASTCASCISNLIAASRVLLQIVTIFVAISVTTTGL